MTGGESDVGRVPPEDVRRRQAGEEEYTEPSSVLGELMRQAMDDGYSLAAAQPGGTQRGGRWMWGVVAVTALVGLLLTVAANHTRASKPAVAKEKLELIERIEERTARVDALDARSARLQEDINELQNELLAGTASGQELTRKLAALDTLAGSGRVRGPGMRIIVDNAPEDEVAAQETVGTGRILDIDLQQAVNGLWSAGAEAISINGQRLTSLTAIRNADQSITVNYRPLARPYVIEAIGDPETLPGRFAESPGGEWLYLLKAQQNIRLEMFKADELTLPGLSTSKLRYARTEGSQ